MCLSNGIGYSNLVGERLSDWELYNCDEVFNLNNEVFNLNNDLDQIIAEDELGRVLSECDVV